MPKYSTSQEARRQQEEISNKEALMRGRATTRLAHQEVEVVIGMRDRVSLWTLSARRLVALSQLTRKSCSGCDSDPNPSMQRV